MNRIVLLTLVILVSAAQLMAAEKEAIKLDEVVITATRYEDKLSSIPANITVITESDIKNSTAQNIPDLLRTDMGIHVNDITGNRRTVTVDIRGFGETAGSNTLVLVDGRPVNQPDLSGTDWMQIPLDRVKKIEIIRGGSGSVLYGDNAAGGVINIITKEGEALKAGAGAAAGSYDTYRGNVYFSNSSDKLSYSLTGSYLTSDGYRNNSDTEAKDLGFNINYYLGDFVRLNFSTGYHKDNTALPGALKESDFNAGASRTDTVNPDDFAEVEDYYFKGGPEFYFWDESLIKLDISYRKRAFLSFSSFAFGEFLGDAEIKTVALSPQILLKNKIGQVNNSLTIGFDYQDSEEDILNNSLYLGFRSIGEFKLKKENHGYYIHDEINITENFHLSGGYRYDKAEFTFDPSDPDQTSIDEDLFTAGINYTFSENSYVYFSYSRSFRYPVLDELFNFYTNTIDASLTSQKSDSYEFGLRHFFTDSIYAHVNLFRINTGNEIFFNLTTIRNENLDGKTRRDGVEISFSAQPRQWLTINGSYTYMDAKIKGGQFEGSDFPNVPNNKSSLTTIIDLGKGFSIALNGVYIGKRPFVSDFANSFDEQEDYIIINSKLKYQKESLTAFLDINNILDEEYSEYGVLGGFPIEKAFYPSPELNVLFGISFEI